MNSTEEELPEVTVRGLLAGAFDPGGGDVPAVNLVPGAVSGFERHRRRTRVFGGAASVAVLGLAAAAYALVPAGGTAFGVKAGSNGTSPAPTPTPVPPAYDAFANPGTPESQCVGGTWLDTGVTPAQARSNCLFTLPLLRGVFSGDTVVQTRFAVTDKDPAFAKAGLPDLLKNPQIGVPHPAVGAEWSRVMSDPTGEYTMADSGEYSVRTADGSTFGVGIEYSPKGPNQDPNSTCVGGKAAGSGVPCWSVTLADGSPATFVTYPLSGGFEAYVATSGGGQLTFSVNWEVGRYTANVGSALKGYFDFATGTAYDSTAPEVFRFTTDQFRTLIQSQGFGSLEQAYLAHIKA